MPILGADLSYVEPAIHRYCGAPVLPLKLLGAQEFCVKFLRPAPNGPVIVGSTGKMEDVHEI